MMAYRFGYLRRGIGGIVMADTEGDARAKVRDYLDHNNYDVTNIERAVIIWPWCEDEYYDSQNPDVMDCYEK